MVAAMTISHLSTVADVQVYGCLHFDEGEVLRKARVLLNGNPGSANLYIIVGQRPSFVDHLTETEAVDGPDGSIVVTGISQTLVDEVGVHPTDAKVKWVVHPKGCKSCG